MEAHQDVVRERPPRITTHRVRAAILAIVIGLVALEAGSYIVLRFVFRVPMERGGNKPIPHIWLPGDGRLPFRMKTNYTERHHTDEFDTTIRLNNVGMREDTDYTGEHVNIGVIGDSFTFGWGVNVGERYSDVLRTFFPDRLIRSYGYLAGLAPPHYYLFLKYHPEYIPDTLILGLLPVNDLDIDMRDTLMQVDAHGEPIAASLTLRYVTADGALGVGRDPARVSPFLRPLVTSYTGKLLWLGKQQLTSMWNQEWQHAGSRDGTTATALPTVQRDALSYVTRLRDLVRAKGGTMIVFLIPVERELVDHPSPMWEPVKAWLRDHDVAFIDPVEAFAAREREGERLYYKKDGHWNANGHRLAAALIADYIQRSGHHD